MNRALRLEVAGPGTAVLTLDVPGQPVNTLHRELADEFADVLDRLEADDDLRAVVLTSGKSDGFIAGADLHPLGEMCSAREGQSLSKLMQTLTDRTARLDKVTVAAIHGDCLGGGLELALACDARIASDDDATRLALPEIQLGLIPGGGGTWRLPRLVGLVAALDLMLTGRRLDARRARALGLVDALASATDLLDRAVGLAGRLAAVPARQRGRIIRRPMERWFSVAALGNRLALHTGPARRLVLSRARRRVLEQTRGLYPAPERLLEAVRVGLAEGVQAGLDAEARAFGELCISGESRALVSLFFAVTALKKEWAQDPEASGRSTISRLGVIGAGLMGSGIARVSVVNAGADVVIVDRNLQAAEAGVQRVADALAQRVRRGRLGEDGRRALLSRLRAGDPREPLPTLDLVVEAVFEDLALKREILARVEREAPEALFASNTSALSISDIARDCAHPERVVGMHYFSPVERMPLLEVVRTARTDVAAVAACVQLGRRQGKTVVVVNDAPGFFTTRILAPYLNEAARLVSEGVPVEAVDQAMIDFGFPLGPLALLDDVGIAVAEKVAGTLVAAFGERMQPPGALAGLRADDREGRKNGRGFYRYRGGDAVGTSRGRVDRSVYRALGVTPRAGGSPDMARRCAVLMINEAVRCLDEGVLACARDGDVAAVFGLGFPAFLGGPFRYADRLGAASLVSELDAFAARLGPRFEPAALLRRMAAQSRRFHPGDAGHGSREHTSGR